MKLDAMWIAGLVCLLGCSNNDGVLEANSTPLANAGPDQQVPFTGAPVDVVLDGTGSSDTDGTLVAFRWLSATAVPGGGRGRYVPTGETGDWPADYPRVTVRLPEGVWKFSLQVIDEKGSTSLPDVVTITVGTPPAGVGGASGAAGAGGAPVLPVQQTGGAGAPGGGTGGAPGGGTGGM